MCIVLNESQTHYDLLNFKRMWKKYGGRLTNKAWKKRSDKDFYFEKNVSSPKVPIFYYLLVK